MNTYDKALHEWTKQWNNSIKDCFITTKQFNVGGVEMVVPNIYSPLKIVVNGPATIVFWQDGTKTVVKCSKYDSYDLYSAFTAALAIKIFGTNSKVKSTLSNKLKIEKLYYKSKALEDKNGNHRTGS